MDLKRRKQQELPKPPDGGWGWMVVFSSFMIHFITDGVTYTFGIFYSEFLRHFESGKGLTAWVPSIMTGVLYGIGPIVSGLINKYGCRAIAIAGSLLAALGLFLSVYAPNVVTLFFTIGICLGAGFGLLYVPAIVSVTCYFEKKRAFATGIAVCGSGIGSAVFAPVTEWLIQIYGWQKAMLAISIFTLNCCFFGALFRPLKVEDEQCCEEENLDTICIEAPENSEYKNFLSVECEKSPARHSFSAFDSETVDISTSSKLESQTNVTELSANNRSVEKLDNKEDTISVKGPHSHASGLLYRKDVFYSASLMNLPQYVSKPDLFNVSMTSLEKYDNIDHNSPEPEGIMKYFVCSKEVRDTFREMMDFGLLRNQVFLLFAVSNFFTSFGYYIPNIYIKDRAVGDHIATDEQGSILLSIIGASSTVGRLLFGFISDHRCINRLWLYNSCLVICGLSTILSCFAKNYFSIALFCAVFGITCGAHVSLTSIILVDLLGLEKLTNAFGLLLLFQGAASLVGPPVVGWMYDVTNSYDPGFSVAGALIVVSGVMLFVIPYLSVNIEKKYNEKTSVVVVNDD
ncbi:monocarboxylate transporter 9-like protein [Leptotrombidium deliense]|uniref:Monocarboxylate transporter 9-like protein n=1 Tax=Leptotrombidium deliense TaxID=299467 RepID=A0A443SIX0_9ACAR|nr:monocarboxylate transporter 9-like protein [Leptotrombidium deliense]